MNFETALNEQRLILAEGSMFDRLKRLAGEFFDADLAYLGLLYSTKGREVLRDVYTEYISCAINQGFSMTVFTPTWKANRANVEKSQLKQAHANSDAVEYLLELRHELDLNASKALFIGGLVGCKNDCYSPELALCETAAEEFHSWQINSLTQSGVDYIFASTLPSSKEALGIARAASVNNKPYILSFVLDAEGLTLDGQVFSEVINYIDSSVSTPPIGYFVNCIHPSTLLAAHRNLDPSCQTLLNRWMGFQGNTSKKDPRKFDSLNSLENESPDLFAAQTLELSAKFHLKVLGGCCGTGPEHIAAIANRAISLGDF